MKPTAADKRSDPAKPAIERSDLVTGAVKRPAQSLIGKPSKVSRVEFSQMWQSDDSSSASSDRKTMLFTLIIFESSIKLYSFWVLITSFNL